MRCKNCGLENDDNLYICQNCGSPLYDEADINDDSTVEFKKIGNDNDSESDIQNANPNGNNGNNNQQPDEDDKKKKQLTIVIIVLCAVLVAVIAGVIGAVIANNKSDDDATTSSTEISTTMKETTTKELTTESTTQTTVAPKIQCMVTVRANDGGTVDGGGQFEKGESRKITARPNTGYSFEGWFTTDGRLVTQSLSHTFDVTGDVVFVAKFKKNEAPTTTTEKATEKLETTTVNSKGE